MSENSKENKQDNSKLIFTRTVPNKNTEPKPKKKSKGKKGSWFT